MDEFDYGSNRTRTSAVICPLIRKNCYISLCLHSSFYKYQPINANLSQNIYDHKTLDELDYGSNRTRTTGVICPLINKIAIFDFACSLASTIFNQSAQNLAKIDITKRSWMSLIIGLIGLE